MRIFGREPALWLSLISVAIKLAAAFWLHMNTNQQATLNAVASATIGILIAFNVRDGVSAAILGFAQALIACALGFGLHIDPDHQALVMAAAGTVVAMFIRTQAVAPIDSSGLRRPQ